MKRYIPLLAEEGAKREPDRAKPQEKMRRAGGASPIGRSPGKRPAKCLPN